MITRISGKIFDQSEASVILDVQGLFYEIFVPPSVLSRLEESKDDQGNIHLVTYHYFQLSQASGQPILIGFINDIERDFFLQFIKVSGIGPKAAVKALSRPISEITDAIDRADTVYLKKLPGIGAQRAKEIVAKLQGKVSRFGLIQDKNTISTMSKPSSSTMAEELKKDALDVLLQLQYRRGEALEMIEKAGKQSEKIHTVEDLLDQIYKQKANV